MEKYSGFNEIVKIFSNKSAHLNCEQLKANIKIVQTV